MLHVSCCTFVLLLNYTLACPELRTEVPSPGKKHRQNSERKRDFYEPPPDPGRGSFAQGPMEKRSEIAAIFAICDCDAHRGPRKSAISETRESNAALRFKGAMESR